MYTVYECVKTALGQSVRKHQDWFDENNKQITNLLKKKQEASSNWLRDKQSASKHDQLKHLRSKVQLELRWIKDQ